MTTIKGMVQCAGTTYRITRVQGVYEATRILDDVSIGTFLLGPPLTVMPTQVSAEELREVATAAVRGAKTSYANVSRAEVSGVYPTAKARRLLA